MVVTRVILLLRRKGDLLLAVHRAHEAFSIWSAALRFGSSDWRCRHLVGAFVEVDAPLIVAEEAWVDAVVQAH